MLNGVLKVIRDEMFEKMQRLPISFYDTHTNGVGGKSADFFIRQQKSISKVNGYIEEMINRSKSC